MSKNGNGEGTITLRADGRYMARLRIGDGARRTFYGKTRKEVRAKLDAARRDYDSGRLSVDPSKKVGDYLDEWLNQSAGRRVRATTLNSYRLNVERARPYIGGPSTRQAPSHPYSGRIRRSPTGGPLGAERPASS